MKSGCVLQLAILIQGNYKVDETEDIDVDYDESMAEGDMIVNL